MLLWGQYHLSKGTVPQPDLQLSAIIWDIIKMTKNLRHLTNLAIKNYFVSSITLYLKDLTALPQSL